MPDNDAPLFVFGVPAENSAITSSHMRNALEALARTNITSNPSNPPNPRDGMLRVNVSTPSNIVLELYYNGTWRALIQNLTSVGGVAKYATQQYTSATVWTIDHNFGRRPIVQCVNGSGDVIHPLSVNHTSLNRVVVTHSTATAGHIIVTG